MPTAWPFLSEVRASADGRSVVFLFNPRRKNPLVVLDSLQEIPILPRHVIEPLLAASGGDINQFTKLKFEVPVGTGPYTLVSYSAEKIVHLATGRLLGQRRCSFGGKWGGLKYVIDPLYKSNDHDSVALQQGRLDISSSFMPRIWGLKQKQAPTPGTTRSRNFAPAAMPAIFINAQRAPLGDVHLRRAMAFAICYDDIRELAVSGYSEPVKPADPAFRVQGKYYSEEDAQRYGATGLRSGASTRRARCRRLPADLGTRGGADLRCGTQPASACPPFMSSRPRVGRTGRRPSASSYVACARWASTRASASSTAPCTFRRPMPGILTTILFTPSQAPAPSKPWSRFDAVLSNQDFAPVGDKMYKNLGRFNDPRGKDYVRRFDELLDSIPTLTVPADVSAAYRELNILFMQYQPVLPIVYRPEQFYEFSTRVWRGFPTAKNPFLPPLIPSSRLGLGILGHFSPVADAAEPVSRVEALDPMTLAGHPALRHILGRAAWYVLTFLVAVIIRVVLPRLGDSSPVDIIMARSGQNQDAATAREQEETYLKEFGLVLIDGRGEIMRDGSGRPLPTSLPIEFGRYLVLSVQGDSGTSISQYPRRVTEVIGSALPWTLALQLPTIVLGWLVGNTLGAGAHCRRSIDLDRGRATSAIPASAQIAVAGTCSATASMVARPRRWTRTVGMGVSPSRCSCRSATDAATPHPRLTSSSSSGPRDRHAFRWRIHEARQRRRAVCE